MKTICPVSWSEAEAKGTELCPDGPAAVGFEGGRLGAGVELLDGCEPPPPTAPAIPVALSEGAFWVGGSKMSVAPGSATAGVENPDGVDACNVANRSGVGEETTGRLHPSKKKRRKTRRKSLGIFIIEVHSSSIDSI